MLGYITFVALLNLGLGYVLGAFLNCGDGRSFRQFLADWRQLGRKVVATPPASADGGSCSDRRETLVAEPSASTPAVSLATAGPTESPTPAGTPTKGLVTLDYVDQLLTEVTAAGDVSGTPTSVVLLELDPLDDEHCLINDRLLAGIAETVQGLLEDTHTAARFADQRFFLLLPGDDETEATKRAELVRQRIEATEFMADATPVHATVTCALAQVSSDTTTSQIMESLQGALTKAKRLGGNRTYMFDGLAPAPVVPPELNLRPQKCAI